MLGSLIYPRMVARNMGNGRAIVWLRHSPRRQRHAPVGLLQPFGMTTNHHGEFWHLYKKLLTLIASAKDGNGHPKFAPHEITEFYQELAQSQNGSHWVMLLTLASTAEAMTKRLMISADPVAEHNEADIASLTEHIKKWRGEKRLRSKILSYLGQPARLSPYRYMSDLAQDTVITGEEVETWRRLRNSVMHGELVQPWPSEEDEEGLRLMISLVHKLTRAIVEKG